MIDLNLTNDDNKTTLNLAVSHGNGNIVKEIIRHKSFDWKDVDFNNLVAEAVTNRWFKIACNLVSEQPDHKFVDPNVGIFLERCDILTGEINKLKKNSPIRDRKEKDIEIYVKSLNQILAPVVANEREEKKTAGQAIQSAQQYLPVSPEQAAVTQLSNQLECPICMEEMWDTQIWSCSNDHWLCVGCISNPEMEACPICREDFSQEQPTRRYQAESMAKIIRRCFP